MMTLPSFLALETAPANVRAIVADVAAKVGVSPVPEVMTDWNMEREVNAYSNHRIDPNTGAKVYGIFLPPDPLSIFKTEDNLRALIAHELGHIANRDEEEMRRVLHRREYRADAFAASHGFNVASMLKLTPQDGDSESHPSVSARIARVARLRRSK